MSGEKITLWVMIVIGATFWIAALIIPDMQSWVVVFSAVLIAWCAYHLMTFDSESDD